jgi:hypothetical protein
VSGITQTWHVWLVSCAVPKAGYVQFIDGVAGDNWSIDIERLWRLGKFCGLGTIFLQGKGNVLLSFSGVQAEEHKVSAGLTLSRP